jgi:cystathionine beta-lyase
MHFGTPELKQRFFARIPARLLGSPGVTGVDATIAAWDEGQPWFDEIMAQLRANRDWLAQNIGDALPGVTMRLPEATYLAWLDCSALKLPTCAGQFFLDRARVGLNFGEAFGERYAGFTRLNFASPAPVLREVVGRMSDAVRRL